MAIQYPGDENVSKIVEALNLKYKLRGYPVNELYVDTLGLARWQFEVLALTEQGLSMHDAWDAVENSINSIWGITEKIENPFEPGVEPPIPPLPGNGLYIPGQWHPTPQTDFCNLQIDGQVWWFFIGDALFEPAHPKLVRLIDEFKARKYTRINYNLFRGSADNQSKDDFFDKPFELTEALAFCVDIHGMGIILEMGPEGNKQAQAKWPPSKYVSQIKEFIPTVDRYVAEYLLGVEVDEYWQNKDTLAIGDELRKYTNKPIWVHFSSGWHGEWGNEFWKPASNWANGLCFQYKKAEVDNGFSTSHDEIREAIPLYKQRIKTAASHLEIAHGEAFYNRNEQKGIEAAELALSLGAAWSMNGGNGVK